VLLEITEVQAQAQQGMTAPFFCLASDGQSYYVKGLNATRQSQINEWICAHLAQAFGLPIPPFKLIYLSAALNEVLPTSQKSIGIGYMFGSQAKAGVDWLEPHQISRLPESLKRDILVFDKWIHNTDRTAGNHNLIFNPENLELSVIDHNLAFDETYSNTQFFEQHLFGEQWGKISSDWVECEDFKARMRASLNSFDAAWQTLPPEWDWANTEQDVPASRLSKENIHDILRHYEDAKFWTP
jgi:hypothetical protein